MKDFIERMGLDPEDFEWEALGLCVSRAPEIPEVFHSKAVADDRVKAQAYSICASCPVREICLEEGIRNDESGIWGGKTLDKGTIVDE